MGRNRFVFALFLGAVALATTSCAAALLPPRWAWYDVDRRPIGAYPARAGYYTGECILYPVTLLTSSLNPDLDLMRGTGVLVGSIVGAPFHLIGLPFGDMGGDEAAPPEDDGGPGRADDEWAEEYGR